MQTRTLNISLPSELVKEMDSMAKQEYATRSDFIRQAIIEKINNRSRWNDIFTYGQKIGKKMGIKSEEDVYKIFQEYRREKRSGSRGNWFEYFCFRTAIWRQTLCLSQIGIRAGNHRDYQRSGYFRNSGCFSQEIQVCHRPTGGNPETDREKFH